MVEVFSDPPTPPPGTPDADISKSDSPDPVNVGSDLTYTLTVGSVGSADLTGVITVTDTLPNGLTFKSAAGAGWTCNNNGQLVTCTRNGPLAHGTTAPAITLVATVGAAAYPSLSNTACVAAANDANANNNCDTEPTNVNAVDLAIDKTDNPDPVNVGADLTYTLHVENIGGAPTTGVVTVTDSLPAGLTFKSASGTGWTCGHVGQDVTCTMPGPLAGHAVAPDITIVSTVGGALSGKTITNTGKVDTAGDIDPANNQDSEDTRVNQAVVCCAPPPPPPPPPPPTTAAPTTTTTTVAPTTTTTEPPTTTTTAAPQVLAEQVTTTTAPPPEVLGVELARTGFAHMRALLYGGLMTVLFGMLVLLGEIRTRPEFLRRRIR